MENNNNTFTLKDVIFNLLFIVLFVLILLWLFPSKSFLENNGIYNSVETQTNQVFNHNITTMKEAAISYFTTSRLPKKVGDTVKMTLREMRDEKLLLSLIDNNGNVCEEGLSYVELTKEEDEYILKVYLSCSDNEDYILVHLGCYDYCDGDVCEKEEPEEILYKYQYQLVTPCKLTDWSNWSNWTTNYITANSNRKVEAKVETESINTTTTTSCPAGYLYSSHTNKCYKTSNSTDIKDAELLVSYKCEDGYTFDEATKKCKKEVKTTTSVAAKENDITYNCDAYPGYTLNGNKCTKQVTTTIVDTKDATKDATTYNCDAYPGYTLNGDKCTKQVTTTTTEKIDATPIYSTRDEGEYVTYSYYCTKRQCSTKTVRDCSSGTCKYVPQTSCTNVASTCEKTEWVSDIVEYISGYECPDGVLSGNQCIVTVDKKTTDIKNATANATVYNCNAYPGYTLNGNKCTKQVTTTSTDTQNATQNAITYYCENKEHTLDGKLCKYETTNVDVKDAEVINTYSCKTYDGYALNGTKCEKIVTNTESADIITNQTCPAGYTLKDGKCSRNIIKYRYSERSCVGGSVDYKWSNLEADSDLLNKGYVLTGVKEPRSK